MFAFVICARTMNPAIGGPHCTMTTGGAEVFKPIAARIAPKIPDAGDSHPIRLSHMTLHSGPISRAFVIVMVIGSVPWKSAPNAPAVAPAPGDPPLALGWLLPDCAWARVTVIFSGLWSKSTNSKGVISLKIFSRSGIEEPFVDDLECFQGDPLSREIGRAHV